MIIIPAIDIIDGKPVRLLRGNFDTVEQVADDALKTAKSFERVGCKWVHMVDLDGSLKKERVNSEVFLDVVKNTSLNVELGGGIRTMDDISFYVENGVKRIILGSVAVKNPDLVREAVKEFGNKITVGIDAKNGMVATEGWIEESTINYIELAKMMEDVGVKTIIYTDIGRDGTLKGPDIHGLNELNQKVSCDIVASGGITTITDILMLKDKNMYGAILGKCIYKKTLDLMEAIEICK